MAGIPILSNSVKPRGMRWVGRADFLQREIVPSREATHPRCYAPREDRGFGALSLRANDTLLVMLMAGRH